MDLLHQLLIQLVLSVDHLGIGQLLTLVLEDLTDDLVDFEQGVPLGDEFVNVLRVLVASPDLREQRLYHNALDRLHDMLDPELLEDVEEELVTEEGSLIQVLLADKS